jgi:hypothetical protein
MTTNIHRIQFNQHHHTPRESNGTGRRKTTTELCNWCQALAATHVGAALSLARLLLTSDIEEDVGLLLGDHRFGARAHRAVVEVEPVAIAQRERRIVAAAQTENDRIHRFFWGD